MRTLCSLPITTIKIDRAFVSDVHQDRGSQAICDALMVLGAGLDMGVVAEGTEKAEEVAYLARRGCVLFQGYYFARPVPAPVLSVTFDNLRLREAG
jgi:EAL domain-containing protein (putative c-di-GMP-specific phosphodiesterase class I)